MIVADVGYTLKYTHDYFGNRKYPPTDLIYGLLKKEGSYCFFGVVKEITVTAEDLVLHCSANPEAPSTNDYLQVADLLLIFKQEACSGRKMENKKIKIYSPLDEKISGVGAIERQELILLSSILESGQGHSTLGKGGVLFSPAASDLTFPRLWRKHA